MNLSALTALSPCDGRYLAKTASLQPFLSEFALMKYRLLVEIEWFKALAKYQDISEIPTLSDTEIEFLDCIYTNFSLENAEQIKEIEKTTNHDVKAVEYFLKQQIAALSQLNKYSEFIHFACTSEDINNLAYALMLKQARQQILLPIMKKLIDVLHKLAHELAEQSMLARTHGQPATPTTMGKEIMNFVVRLQRETDIFSKILIRGKINGAVGNFNAHVIAYPNIDWPVFAENFVDGLGLQYNPYTSQIEQHDYIAQLFDSLARFNTILIDFNRDIWGYISLNYFTQKTIESEIGSSTMPHKVNPIDFENSEGNLLYANAILKFLGSELTTSRWQRDLVDSTLMRNVGVGIAHSLIAYQSALKGIAKLQINEDYLLADLNKNWEILAEPIQTIMRRYSIEKPYEKLKALTRGKKITQSDIIEFVNHLPLPEEAKKCLLKLSPINYIGLANKLTKNYL